MRRPHIADDRAGDTHTCVTHICSNTTPVKVIFCFNFFFSAISFPFWTYNSIHSYMLCTTRAAIVAVERHRLKCDDKCGRITTERNSKLILIYHFTAAQHKKSVLAHPSVHDSSFYCIWRFQLQLPHTIHYQSLESQGTTREMKNSISTLWQSVWRLCRLKAPPPAFQAALPYQLATLKNPTKSDSVPRSLNSTERVLRIIYRKGTAKNHRRIRDGGIIKTV